MATSYFGLKSREKSSKQSAATTTATSTITNSIIHQSELRDQRERLFKSSWRTSKVEDRKQSGASRIGLCWLGKMYKTRDKEEEEKERESRQRQLHVNSNCFILFTSFVLLLLICTEAVSALQATAKEKVPSSQTSTSQYPEIDTIDNAKTLDGARGVKMSERQSTGAGLTRERIATAPHPQQQHQQRGTKGALIMRHLNKRSPVAAALLQAVSGSKSEPPSRPSSDWSKQKPYFGTDMQRNVSVELGKTAYLTCKVFELGDKTVSWLRPRENEILTAGRYTYIGDSRFASINDNGSHDWILEIKDVGLNDSTSYECQVSTDPKMSYTINLQVKAAKAKIKQGEQFYAHLGNNIEFTCEIGQRAPGYSQMLIAAQSSGLQQTYWYFNGNLLNYARTTQMEKNFSIDWDPLTQTSRFKLFAVQATDAGNYTCKPTSAEPATIRLHVKRANKGATRDRTHNHGSGHYSLNAKEDQRIRQHYALDSSGSSGSELGMDSGGYKPSILSLSTIILISCLINLLLITSRHQ